MLQMIDQRRGSHYYPPGSLRPHMERQEAERRVDPLTCMREGIMLLVHAPAEDPHFDKCPVYMGKVLAWNEEQKTMKIHWWKRFMQSTHWTTSSWVPHYYRSNQRQPSIDERFQYDEKSICLFDFELRRDGHLTSQDVQLAQTRLVESTIPFEGDNSSLDDEEEIANDEEASDVHSQSDS